jgi:1-acyl-sn-glycerol-3-phosphate acyltransferase
MSTKEKIVFILFTYPAGVFMGILLLIARMLGAIKVQGRVPKPDHGLLVICNHPAIFETFLVPALFFKYYFFHPFRYTPFSVPDKRNFYDPWYFFWMRPVLISIDRVVGFSVSSSNKMRDVLNSHRIIIYYPEGGRTFKGKNFSYSNTGKRVRSFQRGAAWLLKKHDPEVLPIWVDGTDRFMPGTWEKLFSWPRFRERIVVKIGEVVQLDSTEDEEVLTEKLKDLLLKTADKEG